MRLSDLIFPQHQQDEGLLEYLLNPSRLGPNAAELRQQPNLPAMTNRTPIQGRRDAAPQQLPSRLPQQRASLPGFPGQARVGLQNLGEAASDIYGMATQGPSYRRPPAVAEGLVKQAPPPIVDLQAPAQITPTDRSSLEDASNPLNGSLADYINTTMGLRVADTPQQNEPWRQVADAPQIGGMPQIAPGMPAPQRGLEPPSASGQQNSVAQENEAVRAAIALARQHIQALGNPDATGLRDQGRRDLDQMRREWREPDHRIPRLMAYQDFNRNR